MLTVEDGPMKGSWVMGALTVADFGLIEQHLLADQQDPVDAVLPQVKRLEEAGQVAMARRLERMAFRQLLKKPGANRIPAAEVAEWIDTVEGLIFSVWIMLRKNHPELTLEQARRIHDAVGAQDVKRRRDKAAALDRLGNSTGPAGGDAAAGPNGAAAAATNGAATPCPGGGSTDNSPSNTAGGRTSSAE